MAVQEHRLALVLNGGVSLAIWMGGVCHEIDVLRRASAGLDPGADLTRAEDAVFRAWQSACAGSPRLVVDVISGTSAGGLNGVFLAAAVARRGSLGPLKRLWFGQAQLDADHLLGARRERTSINELLDGRFLHEQIGDALRDIRPEQSGSAGDDWSGRAVRLVTTASAASGPGRDFRDTPGRRFTVADHRRRFGFRARPRSFEYHPERWGDPFTERPAVNDFDPSTGTIDELAWAARATASIPGVFDPVAETRGLRLKRELPEAEDGSPLDWLLDGGLLDNAPIETVLEFIARQPVTSTWERTMAYIVPATEAADPSQSARPSASSADAPPTKPPPWTTSLPKLLSYPGESNLRSGIDRLDDMLQSARPDIDAVRLRTLIRQGAPAIDGLVAAASAIFPYYRSARAGAGIAEAVQLASSGRMRWLRTPEWSSIEKDLSAPMAWLPRTFAVPGVDRWDWGFSVADRTVRLFLRSIRTTEGVTFDDARTRLHDLTEKLQAVRVVLLGRLKALSADGSPNDTAERVNAIYRELKLEQTLGAIVFEAAEVLRHSLGEPADVQQLLAAALGLEVVNGAAGLPVDYHPTPTFKFARFDVEVPADVFDFDIADANPADLLYGTRLGHFAAFGRAEWRRWDWMWGRVSGAVHLCRLLGREEKIPHLVRAILRAEGYEPAEVNRRAKELLDGDAWSAPQILAALRADGTLGVAVDAALKVAASSPDTDPRLPAVVEQVGSRLAAALAREPRLQFPRPGRRRLQPSAAIARIAAVIARCVLRSLFRGGIGASGPSPILRALGSLVRVPLWGVLAQRRR